jgi:uncharacterized ABC transporter ATP-binding protein yhcH
MEKVVLEIKNVSKSFGRTKIIDNLTFSVNSGEIFGFLGPNGAGKTTTMKMVLGLIPFSEGDICINGYSIKKDFEKAMQNVGGIVENPDLYEYMTGYENLKLVARIYKVDKKRIDEIVDIVGLKEKIKLKVKKYSLGMKQRMSVALALIRNPKLLVLDEPTNGLDPVAIHELRDLLKDLAHNRGVCVFVSSHLLSEVELMCDRVGILDKGRLIKIEDLKNIIEIKDKNDNEAIYKIITNDNKRAKDILVNNGYSVKDEKEALEVSIKKDKIDSLINIMLSNGITVYEFSIKKATLEEEYLNVTGGKINE